MKQPFKFITFFVLCVLMPAGTVLSQGIINVQNGNFNHFFKDFDIPGHGFSLKLERSYNSKSNYKGMFGHKWGSNFDIDFKETPEGTVEITEFGGGFKTIFSPQGFTQKNINDFVQKILQKLPEASKTPTLETSLSNDPKLRYKLAKEYNVKIVLSPDTKLFANDRGPETLEKTQKSGYPGFVWLRTFSDGKKEYFDSNGKLVMYEDTHRNFLKLSYNTLGLLETVTDSSGRKIIFKYHQNKKVSTVTSPLGETKTCSYQYSDSGDLISAKNARGYTFLHLYDGRHNMVEVKYPTHQKETMEFDLEDRVTLHSGPEDIITRYKYDDKGNSNKYFYVTVTKEIGKKPNQAITVDKYEYEFGRRDNGTHYTYKLATLLDGVRTETIYTSCCGKPISIARNGSITRFEYFPNGNLKKKISPTGEMIVLTYDEKFGKVSQVDRADPEQPSTDTTSYKYDQKGNLALAKNERKKIHVQLIYDTKGRIKKLMDQSGKKIEFDYNELGKPTKISLEGVGSIFVSYNAAGEITNVKSTGGRKIATEVTSTFQTLLDVIRPAGVSLNI